MATIKFGWNAKLGAALVNGGVVFHLHCKACLFQALGPLLAAAATVLSANSEKTMMSGLRTSASA
jgi:hypothetical protein